MIQKKKKLGSNLSDECSYNIYTNMFEKTNYLDLIIRQHSKGIHVEFFFYSKFSNLLKIAPNIIF